MSTVLWILGAVAVFPILLWIVSYSISQGWHAGKFIQLSRWTHKKDKND